MQQKCNKELPFYNCILSSLKAWWRWSPERFAVSHLICYAVYVGRCNHSTAAAAFLGWRGHWSGHSNKNRWVKGLLACSEDRPYAILHFSCTHTMWKGVCTNAFNSDKVQQNCLISADSNKFDHLSDAAIKGFISGACSSGAGGFLCGAGISGRCDLIMPWFTHAIAEQYLEDCAKAWDYTF